MLSASDPLPAPPRRVLVAGVAGSGKSTLARRMGSLWNLPYTELDSLFHGAGWTKRPSFETDLAALADTERWITEWGYWNSGARSILGPRAELMIWLDYPRRIVLPRIVRRTVRRRIRREVLWNGNVEPHLHTFFTKPEANIVRWNLKTQHSWRERMPEFQAELPHLTIVRLRHPRETKRWLSQVTAHEGMSAAAVSPRRLRRAQGHQE